MQTVIEYWLKRNGGPQTNDHNTMTLYGHYSEKEAIAEVAHRLGASTSEIRVSVSYK